MNNLALSPTHPRNSLPDVDAARASFAARAIDRGDECWGWSGALTPNGYAQMPLCRSMWLGHRVAWMLVHGSIQDGLVLDHLCRNRACVNVAHLELVTVRENTMRGLNHTAAQARATKCIHGHAFDEKNTYYTKTGRSCRRCKADAAARYKRRAGVDE